MSPTIPTSAEFKTLLELLTPREREILPLYLEGMNPQRIAHRLRSKYGTIGHHLHNMKRKMKFLGLHFGRAILKFSKTTKP